MKILAKGIPVGGFWGHGRHWPRAHAVEVEVTHEEAQRILADDHIVAIVIPELPSASPAVPSATKDSKSTKRA